MLGHLLLFLRRNREALPALQRAVALEPAPDRLIWLCLCLDGLDRRDDALFLLDRLVDGSPAQANVQFAAALLSERFDQVDRARVLLERCLASAPGHADALHRLARLGHARGELEAAVDNYRRAIRACATRADFHVDLGAALCGLGRFVEAEGAVRTALALDRNSAEACNNLGHALLNLNRSAAAVSCYREAVALRPDYPTARFGLALALLKAGDWSRGWREYEWRWQDCQRPRTDLAGLPPWQGEPLDGRRILLHAEQGFGDTLQSCASRPSSRNAAAASCWKCRRRCCGCCERCADRKRWWPPARHCRRSACTARWPACRSGSGSSRTTCPVRPTFPCPARANRPLPPAGRRAADDLVVGLVWASDPRPWERRSALIDRRRSVALRDLAPLFAVRGVRFLGFQLGAACAEAAPSAWPVADAMRGVEDFADTAARLAGIDLLVSVDTAMVHLAGGLGMPVWMMSRFDGCWRWLENRADTPWYPSMRIFRQPRPGDWQAVAVEVAAALADAVAARRECAFQAA